MHVVYGLIAQESVIPLDLSNVAKKSKIGNRILERWANVCYYKQAAHLSAVQR